MTDDKVPSKKQEINHPEGSKEVKHLEENLLSLEQWISQTVHPEIQVSQSNFLNLIGNALKIRFICIWFTRIGISTW